MSDLQIIFTIIIGCFILLVPVVIFTREKKLWNNGVCEKTGEPWELVDIDDFGSRSYKSKEHQIWISYTFIDK